MNLEFATSLIQTHALSFFFVSFAFFVVWGLLCEEGVDGSGDGKCKNFGDKSPRMA